MGFIDALKEKLGGTAYDELEAEQGYLELDSTAMGDKKKMVVHPFLLEDFEDVKPVLDSLREGQTIALVNIKPLKERDLVELKRAINKLKKTTDAIEGEIAGFGEDYVVVCPSSATIHRSSRQIKQVKTDESVPE
ncbi:cell division protein SepF [Candidatus Woesearchaeota archaeon]|nr:cell division protein SepF [Candidatus Woesearchaeota archaeon]